MRSQFEKISNHELAPDAVIRPPTAIQTEGRTSKGQEHQQLLGASLDVLQRSSPWSRAKSFEELQRSGRGSQQVHPQTGLPFLLRPTPMTAFSVPQPSPLLEVESSSSPPKSPLSSQKADVTSSKSLDEMHVSAIPSTLIPNQNNPGAYIPSKGFFQRTHRDQPNVSQSSMGNISQPPSVRRPLTDGSDNLRSNNRVVPPPINRADKPTRAPKSTEIVRQIGLTATLPSTQAKLSPFSNSPTNDEGKISNHIFPDDNSSAFATSASFLDPQRSGSQHIITSTAAGSSSPSTGADVKPINFGAPTLPPTKETGTKPQLPSRTSLGNRGRPSIVGTLRSSPITNRSSPRTQNTPNSYACGPSPSLSKQDPFHGLFQPYETRKPDLKPLPGSKREFARSSEAELMSNTRIDYASDYPDTSDVSRRFPYCPTGSRSIDIGHDARLIDICNRNVCTAGYITRVWDVVTGEMLLSIGNSERETKVSALAFKPSAKSNDEGSRLWLGTNHGDLQEVDIASQRILCTKFAAHERREIVAIHRHQNAMWTIDNGGMLYVWPGDEKGLPSLQRSPDVHRVQKGHTCSIVIQDCLWLASGKEIGIFKPSAADSTCFEILQTPLCQPHIGIITSGCVVSDQTDRVYFGHADGKVSMYSIIDFTCLGIISISSYRINSLVGAGSYLWAAFSMGLIFVYDTRSAPWKTKKCWLGHQGSSINSLVADQSSLWKFGTLRLVSNGSDNAIRFWDGMLQDDWLGNDATSAQFYPF